mgnify:CR=1 FL=1
MHPRSPPNSSWLLSYCLLSAWWRALLGPCRRSRWSFSVHLKVNNSATKTSLAMILDAYESPSHRLSHAVPLVSRFKVKYVPVQIFPPFMKTSKLPVHSTLYNSATRTSLAMILDSYESPTVTLDFGAFAFLPPSLGPPGDCPWRHYVRVESWFPWQVTRAAGPRDRCCTRATRNQREIWYMESGPSRVNAPLGDL